MIVAIHQPQYVPWLGYFDKIDRADHFVLLDTVQYKKNEFQNRNKVKTAQGWQWLTVPVRYKFPMPIAEVPINNDVNWRHKHWQALITHYNKAPFFAPHASAWEALYDQNWTHLTDINYSAIDLLLRTLDIQTPVHNARTWCLSSDPTGRLVDICKNLGASTYLSGAGGRDYLDLPQFEQADIKVVFQDFKHPVYAQQFGAFEPYMSTLDLVFNCGPQSLKILRKGMHS